MHPNGNLGPTDPQIRIQRRSPKDGSVEALSFGSEDLMAFLNFSRDQVGLKDPQQMVTVYSKFCDEVSAMGVGVSARSALLSVSLGERLLRLHMKGDEEEKKASTISQKLTKDYLHHGYPVNRSEAKSVGLKVAQPDEELEDLMWKIWCDISDELRLREPHFPLTVLANNAACQPLFDPIPIVQLPANLPPQVAQQAYAQVMNQIMVASVPPAPFQLIHALVESRRTASRFITEGLVVGTKTADHQIRISTLNLKQGWTDALPAPRKSQVPPAAGPMPPAGLAVGPAPAAAPAAVAAPAPIPAPIAVPQNPGKPSSKAKRGHQKAGKRSQKNR
jgi:hypothetical protein